MKKESTQKHTLHLFVGDYAKLQELYPSVSAAAVIRTLVRKNIEAVEQNVDAAVAVADIEYPL